MYCILDGDLKKFINEKETFGIGNALYLEESYDFPDGTGRDADIQQSLWQ